MTIAECIEICSRTPRPYSWLVQLCAVEISTVTLIIASEVSTSRDQNLAVGQQGRCVVITAAEIAGIAPHPRGWVV